MRNPIAPKGPGMGAAPDKARNSRRTLMRLLPYWREHLWTMIGLLACSCVTVGVTLTSPIIIGRTIDECIQHGADGWSVDYERMTIYLGALAAVYLIGAVVSWMQSYGMVCVSQKIVLKMRKQMMDHLLTLDVKYYDKNQRGDLLSRFSNDAKLVKQGIGDALIQVVTTVFSIVGMIVSMIMMSAKLTLLVCLSIPLVLLLTKVIVGRSRRFFSRQQEALGNMNAVIEESINGLQAIRSFGCEEEWRARFSKANDALRRSGTKAQINSGLMMPLLRVLDNLTYILVAVVGGMMAIAGELTVGSIQTFLLYTKHFLRPVNQIATQLNTLQSAIAGAERVFELLDEKPAIVSKEGAVFLDKPKGEVVFEHVSFGYSPEKQILKDISFTAKPGQIVAIVGSTGAGKTTLMNLLERFYDVDGGRITIDGHDIRDIDVRNLRDSLAIVLQEPVLFSDTIRNNIAYGNPSLSEDEMKESARMAMADSFIERLPHGYDTMLVHQGENVSNGQRQLLTIARAIHSEASVLILDEATSNIDTHTEMLLQAAISNMTAGKTCFMIAHRLSTIRNADNILVMDAGHIAEQGTHEELLAKGGIYRSIYDSQFEKIED